MCTHPLVFPPNPQPRVTLTIHSAFFSFWGYYGLLYHQITRDFVHDSPLSQQSAVSEADSPHSTQNRENSTPSTTGENSGDQADLSAGRGSLRCQGTDYTILDESSSEQALSLSQGDAILELVSYPEALQIALWPLFGDFVSLRFDVSGQPHVVFRSVGPIQVARQTARAPSHSVSNSTPQADARSPAGPPVKCYHNGLAFNNLLSR